MNTPSVTQIIGIKSIEDIDGLKVGTTRYKARNFIPVPPFLIEVVHKEISLSNGNGNVNQAFNENY